MSRPNILIMLDNASKVQSRADDSMKSAVLNQIAIMTELETLKNATLTGVTANMFVETFLNLDDITLTSGVYDNVNQKLEI